MTWPGAPTLIQAACGLMHTLLLTDDGKVYSCGNNDHGQLGHEMIPRKRPRMSIFHLVQSLAEYKIAQVSCGATHSIAVSDWGQLFSWGSNNIGQLDHTIGSDMQPQPKIVRELGTKHVVQVACGDYHSIVLMKNGELYAWGSNEFGQLGLGFNSEKIVKSSLIASLSGIPFAFVACGSNHSFAVSRSGAVFGWGKNTSGQLGLSNETSKYFPCQLKTLRSRGIRYIACGEDFSVFLTQDGGVFTCGSGKYGQLGHGRSGNEILPRMVMELMGSTITQISCGRRHTLTFVQSSGRIYGFGLGGSGQLGSRGSVNAFVPQVVLGPWVSPCDSSALNGHPESGAVDDVTNTDMVIKRIYSGDHCFVSLIAKDSPSDDYRVYPESTQILSLTPELIESLVGLESTTKVADDLMTAIETIFKSQCCMNASFLIKKPDCCTMKCPGWD